jgi:CubicO group peptidase (beta-lactamase class C family)
MLAIIQSNRSLYSIDSMTIIRNGYMVFDATFFPFPPDSKHNLKSCTKSIVSALVGIAIEQGYIESAQQPVLDLFPERTAANLTADKEAMTLENVLTMATGLKCQDSYLYNWRGYDEMRQSPDWVQFMLDLPMAEEPGTRFEYCNGASFLLSAIIQETTGMTALEFAEQHLFTPLGISDTAWPSNPQGIVLGWGALRMRPHDMAKIGYLYLNEGLWDGEQVVSSAWVEASTRKHISAGTLEDGYGYQWWVDVSGTYMALGTRGQYIVVVPEKEMVVVFTSDLADVSFFVPRYMVNSFIFPAAKSLTPLPANPDGVARLQSLIQEAAGQPEVAPQPVPPPPAIAEQVLGQTYILEKNALGVESFSLVRQEEVEALLRLTFDETAPCTEVEYQIGLDGVQRLSTGIYGMPVSQKGRWDGENVFISEVDEIGDSSKYRVEYEFIDDKVTVTLFLAERIEIHGKRAESP